MGSSKVRSLLWYLKHPGFYRDLWRQLSRRISPKQRRLDNTRRESVAWCEKRAVDTSAAIKTITGSEMPGSVMEKYADLFDVAEQTARECPVKMGGPGNGDLLYWLAEYCAATRIIETGVAYGWSSLALLLSLRNRQGSRLISTDRPYPGMNNEKYVGCVVPNQLRTPWHIIHKADVQGIPMALKELPTIDMCHYDSDKSHAGRTWTYSQLWEALRPGGFFISDDIGDNVAFRDFADFVRVDPVIVELQEKHVGVLVKPSQT